MSSGRSEGGKRTGLARYTFEVFSCRDGYGSSHEWGGRLPHVLRVRARGDAVDAAARLTREPHVPPWSHGSLSMNHALMAAGLGDGLQVTIFPVITAITAITGHHGTHGPGPDTRWRGGVRPRAARSPNHGRAHPGA
jgi:hypothetical protein